MTLFSNWGIKSKVRFFYHYAHNRLLKTSGSAVLLPESRSEKGFWKAFPWQRRQGKLREEAATLQGQPPRQLPALTSGGLVLLLSGVNM